MDKIFPETLENDQQPIPSVSDIHNLQGVTSGRSC